MNKNKILIVIIIIIGLIVSFPLFRGYAADITTLKNRIEELEIENQAIKEHYKTEYELRNGLDLKARKIYDAMEEKDLDTLQKAVTSSAEVLEDRMVFNSDNMENVYDFSYSSEVPFVLRQRYYELSPDKRTFVTGYEIIIKGAEQIPVITMIFTYENGKWKLSNLLPE